MGIGGGGGAPPLAQDPSLSTLIRNASTNPSTNRMDTDYQMQDARLGSHFLSAFHPSSMDNDAFAGGLADHQAAARIITHCPAPPVAENEVSLCRARWAAWSVMRQLTRCIITRRNGSQHCTTFAFLTHRSECFQNWCAPTRV